MNTILKKSVSSVIKGNKKRKVKFESELGSFWDQGISGSDSEPELYGVYILNLEESVKEQTNNYK